MPMFFGTQVLPYKLSAWALIQIVWQDMLIFAATLRRFKTWVFSFWLLFKNQTFLFICASMHICKENKTLGYFYYHLNLCPEQRVHVHRTSHLCLLPNAGPPSHSLLGGSMCADWQWVQPGQRPESSGASWPRHTLGSLLITQNMCPHIQQRRKGEMHWKAVIRPWCHDWLYRYFSDCK